MSELLPTESSEPQVEATSTPSVDVPQNEPSWLDSVPEEYRDASFVTKYGDKKEDFFSGMANLTKMIGQRKSDIPDFENATPEELNAFREKLGVPTESNGYELNTPEDFQADDTYNNFLEIAHKNNISNTGAQQLFEMYQESISSMVADAHVQQNAQIAQAFEEFKNDPKSVEMETNAVDVLSAVDPTGSILKPEEIASFGVNAPKVIKLLNEINNKMFSSDSTPKATASAVNGAGSYADKYSSIMQRVNKGLISKEQGSAEINALTQHYS